MAVRYAVNNGNWSSVGTWDGGASLPTVGDDVYANGYSVEIDQDITVTKISTEVCPTTSVGGGKFTCYTYISFTVNRIITSNIIAGSTNCLITNQTNVQIIIVGNIVGGNSANAYGYFCNATDYYVSVGMSPIIIGNVTGGSHSTAYGFQTRNDRSYSPTFAGNITAGSAAYAIRMQCGGQTPIINGNITAINNVSAVNVSSGSIYLTGIFTASVGSTGWAVYGNGCTYFVSGHNIYASDGTPGLNLSTSTGIKIQTGGSYTETIPTEDASTKTLYTDFDQPLESDVREGVEYGSSVYTGTLIVPPAASVVKDVPVDDTVGTWAFDAELITRLQQCSTVPITGQQIASYNGAPAELIPYNEKRTDYVSGTPDILYLGTAPVGTLDASPVWNLTKLELAIDGSISSETHSTDSWDNHLTAIYS